MTGTVDNVPNHADALLARARKHDLKPLWLNVDEHHMRLLVNDRKFTYAGGSDGRDLTWRGVVLKATYTQPPVSPVGVAELTPELALEPLPRSLTEITLVAEHRNGRIVYLDDPATDPFFAIPQQEQLK